MGVVDGVDGYMGWFLLFVMSSYISDVVFSKSE